ncbi:SGNH/GDSL hydrolase family protein [Azospirillum sp. RWY-5-1]|uniref:SGNH/GDSL hydrolase family protein n=1 Tax=Azospirillum oleiclasticum TaxID=2735135 RepID=A0ABX2TLE9_9PROT|nr:SGNH/GDSL hydrolase family protein [Azospirillum oleiclasticum]NYZ18038.1 SGNH/GDSL hydrolase family protein [Azospirillum oleiclasticum]NYZ25187.1 SGNH/GDSL hydrolase family protein [Azospirillum oleiclasticum]
MNLMPVQILYHPSEIDKSLPNYVYGTGSCSTVFMEQASKIGLRVDGFIQTDCEENKVFFGKKVWNVRDFPNTNEKTNIIIASDQFQYIALVISVFFNKNSVIWNAYYFVNTIKQITLHESNYANSDAFFKSIQEKRWDDFGYDNSKKIKSDIIVIGDSFSYHADWSNMYPHRSTINRSLPSLSTFLIEEYYKLVNIEYCEILVIHIGFPDLRNLMTVNPLQIYENVRNFCSARAAEGMACCLISIPPITKREKSRLFSMSSVFNLIAVEINSLFEAFSRANGHKFVNLWNDMVDEKGIKDEFLANDMIHYNRIGQNFMVRHVAQAISEWRPHDFSPTETAEPKS